MKKVLLGLLMLVPYFILAQGIGHKYYVAVYGNDSNPGTIEKPFATWQRGFTATNMPGDTLFIRGGVYVSEVPVGYNPEWPSNLGGARGGIGTRKNPIVIMGYPGEWPILDCTFHCDNIPKRIHGPTYNSAIGINGTEFIHFKDFEVRNVFQCDSVVAGAIEVTYSCNLTFEHLIVHNVGQRGYYVNGGVWTSSDGPDVNIPIEASKWGFDHPDTTRWINCDVYNLADTLSEAPGNAADAWKTIHYNKNVVIWDGCRAWNYTDDGLDPNGKGSERIIRNCWMMPGDKYKGNISKGWDVERNGIKASGPQHYYHSDVNHLVVENCVTYDATHGIIIMENGDYNRLNALIYNNTIFGCGIGIANWDDDRINVKSPNIYKNNLIYGTTRRNPVDEPSDVFIVTNVPYDVSHSTWQWSGVEHQNYSPNPAYNVTRADFKSVNHAAIFAELTAPRKANGSLPDITTLQLTPNSKLIDAGIDVGLSYYGAAPDLGAFEYIPKGKDSNDSFRILESQPSPTADLFVIYFNCIKNTKIAVSVVDEGGKSVLSQSFSAKPNRNKLLLNLISLDKGEYTVILNDNGNKISTKVIKL